MILRELIQKLIASTESVGMDAPVVFRDDDQELDFQDVAIFTDVGNDLDPERVLVQLHNAA